MATIQEKLEALETELALVKAAILAAYTGQEYEIESGNSRRKLKRQSLEDLAKRQADLELAIARLDGSRGVSHGLIC